MKKFQQISAVLDMLYLGKIKNVTVNFIHPENGLMRSDTTNDGIEFAEVIKIIYNWKWEVEFEVVTNTDVIIKLSDKTDINKFWEFALNYDHGFIDKIWSGDLAENLKSKWTSAYEQAGSYGVVVKFYSFLSDNNRELFEAYILKNK